MDHPYDTRGIAEAHNTVWRSWRRYQYTSCHKRRAGWASSICIITRRRPDGAGPPAVWQPVHTENIYLRLFLTCEVGEHLCLSCTPVVRHPPVPAFQPHTTVERNKIKTFKVEVHFMSTYSCDAGVCPTGGGIRSAQLATSSAASGVSIQDPHDVTNRPSANEKQNSLFKIKVQVLIFDLWFIIYPDSHNSFIHHSHLLDGRRKSVWNGFELCWTFSPTFFKSNFVPVVCNHKHFDSSRSRVHDIMNLWIWAGLMCYYLTCQWVVTY